MQIHLQDFVPYRDSLKWKIHNNYFLKKGAEAWINGEVPYDITCNSCAAYQNATLVFEAVRNMEAAGELAASERINVVEFASGVGLFAINFIKQFKEICERKNVDYAERLVFFVSDYAEKSVRDAMRNPTLWGLHEQGVIRFALADACEPQSMTDLLTGEALGGVKFAAAVANYLHCVLPLTILQKKDGKLFERYTALEMDVPREKLPDNQGLLSKGGLLSNDFIMDEINNPTGDKLWPEIKEKHEYRPIDVETFFVDKSHFAVIEDCVKYYDLATVIYPFGSFEGMKNFKPMMKRGAIYIISDKGYADFFYMFGDRECPPSLHGNSFAHSFNFPLAELYAQRLGFSAWRTHNPEYSIQTLVLENPGSGDGQLAQRFNELYIRENPNQDSNDFMVTVLEYEKNKDFEKAITFLKKVLKLRPYDAKVFYKLGNNYFDARQYNQSLDYYSRGQKYDYFNLYDFDFEIGQSNYYLGLYEPAIEAYRKSVVRKMYNQKFAYFNIGLCYNYLKHFDEAETAFRKALEIDPAYERAKKCIVENAKHLILD